MARSKNVVPSYSLHKPTGQAQVRVDGKMFYLGEYGSEKSRIRYSEIIAKLTSGVPIDPIGIAKRKRNANSGQDPDSGPSVAELVLAFKSHSEAYYRKPNGKMTDEVQCLKSAMKPVRELFGLVPTRDFTPLMLKTVRETYIGNGWTRGFCNRSTNRIRSMFKWGVENGIVPVATWQALTAISPLKAGRCEAHDNDRREAVSDENIQLVKARLEQRNRDIVDLLLLSGCRIGELLSLTWPMIDRSGETWEAELKNHKTAYRGKIRKLHFGKQAQAILNRYLGTPTSQTIFNLRRDTFSKSITSACHRAGVPKFVPHQLRHTAGTRIRDEIGVEAAQAVLGHAAAAMTAIYTRNTDRLARSAAAKMG
jgi:integrase